MKIENIIRRVLREQEEEKLLKIPSLKFFNNDWNVLQMFLESQGNPRYSISGNLDLTLSDIESLGSLVRVEGDLDLSFSDIKTLGNLVRVEGNLVLNHSNIESLGSLEYVGGDLSLYFCQNLETLGNLNYVGSNLNISRTNIESLGNLEYVGGHLDIYKTPLSKKYTEEQIRRMVNVIGRIYNK